MKKIAVVFLFFFLCHIAKVTASVDEEQPTYVGTDGCRCHKLEIMDWERSKHARAFNHLRAGKKKSKKRKVNLDPAKDYTTDKKCIKCHVTGYEKEGGFKDISRTPAMAGIGCEMCHGPGSEYRILHKQKGLTFTKEEAKALGQIYGSLDIQVCTRCHTHKDSPFLPKVHKKYIFDLKEKLKEEIV